MDFSPNHCSPDVDTNATPFFHFSCPHITPKPGTPGRVFWLSGPPGAGKSTTCQLLARDNSYIYYEADCTASLINPFTDVNVENPSMASFGSAPLKVTSKIMFYKLPATKVSKAFCQLFHRTKKLASFRVPPKPIH